MEFIVRLSFSFVSIVYSVIYLEQWNVFPASERLKWDKTGFSVDYFVESKLKSIVYEEKKGK